MDFDKIIVRFRAIKKSFLNIAHDYSQPKLAISEIELSIQLERSHNPNFSDCFRTLTLQI